MKKRNELTLVVDNTGQTLGALSWARQWIDRGLAGGAVMISIGRPRRTLDQNNKLWPMLTDVARQCELIVNGKAVKAQKEDWKVVFTAALENEQRWAQGINGGIVMLGSSTRALSKKKFRDLIELIYAYGAEHGVVWSERARQDFCELREVA
ncbi:MAG: recombination protein NinB [Spongiibacter sp.]|nr:recombination protein NinB [Spongiibacter sp.]